MSRPAAYEHDAWRSPALSGGLGLELARYRPAAERHGRTTVSAALELRDGEDRAARGELLLRAFAAGLASAGLELDPAGPTPRISVHVCYSTHYRGDPATRHVVLLLLAAVRLAPGADRVAR